MEQNKIIELTKNKFEMIGVEVHDLNNTIQHTETIMEKILASTEVISDHISQLSATSEEVAAASNEGVTNALSYNFV